MDSIFRGVWLIKFFRNVCNTVSCLACSSRSLSCPHQELESGHISLGEPLWLSELTGWGGSEVMWLLRSSHKSKYNFYLALSVWMLTLGIRPLCFKEPWAHGGIHGRGIEASGPEPQLSSQLTVGTNGQSFWVSHLGGKSFSPWFNHPILHLME